MKTTTVLIAFALSALGSPGAGAQEPMDLGQLVRRGDSYLHPGTFEPFAGPVAGWWTAGAASEGMPRMLRERGTLVDGKWDGVHEWFHLSGELATMETYRNGRLNGPSETYFKTGQLSAREHYVNGQLDGPYESYWHRGRLAERGEWDAGEPCGNWLSFGRTVIYPPCAAQ
jgi:hypothetical protein